MSAVTSEAATDAERYLREVARHLGGLNAEEQAELLEDLNQHLMEVAAEPGPPLQERLGPPEAYAAELLASAGVSARTIDTGVVARLQARASSLRSRIAQSAVGREAVRVWPALRPAWWVARGYLAVALVAAIGTGVGSPGFPVPELFGSRLLGLAAIAMAVPLSVRLAQRELSRAGRTAVIVANGVLLIFGLVLLGRAGQPDVRYVDTGAFVRVGPSAAGCLTDASGRPITNLYAYDSEGRLLDPVLLYDDLGRPVDNLCPEYGRDGRHLSTEYRRDVNGAPVINAFPRKQFEHDPAGPPFTAPQQPGSPDPGVSVRPPAVVVPKLAPTTTATTAPTSSTVPGAPPGG